MNTPHSTTQGLPPSEDSLDPLTGLPGQVSLLEHLRNALGRAEESGRKIAVMYLDVDGFTQASQDLGPGQEAGLLKTLAKRIMHCVRDQDFAARYKEDEFVVVLEQVVQGKDIIDVARRLHGSMAEPLVQRDSDVPGKSISLGASMGIAVYPDHGLDADTLLANAHTAMNEVKRSGKNDFMYFGSA